MVQNTGYDHLVQFCKICFLMYIFMNWLHYFVNLFAHFYIHWAKLLLHLYCFFFYGFSCCFFFPPISGISISVKLFLFSFLLVFEGVFSNEDYYYSELHIFQWICYLWVHVLPCRLCALWGRVYWYFSANIKPCFVPLTTLLSTTEK